MKIKNLFLVIVILAAVLLSGCNLVPDKASQLMFGWMMPDPNVPPYNRVDVWNKMPGTYMVLSDRGGEKPDHILYGKKGWLPMNTYFNANGYDRVNDNIITATFYDATTGDEIGPWHCPIYRDSEPYQVIDSPTDRETPRQQQWISSW